MTQQKKKNLDLEQQIQNLAGDIYVEIEDKVSNFVASYIKNKEFSNDDIEQHKHYQLLKSKYEQLQNTFDTAQEGSTKEQNKFQKDIKSVNEKLIESNKELSDLKKLNTVELTDSEKVLQKKISELSTLSEQLKSSAASEKKLKAALAKAEENTIQLTQKIELLEESATNFDKNDKAKSATLTVQNQQLSALTLQLNNVVSELDYIKAEHNQNLALTVQEQTQKQQQLIELQKSVAHLKDEKTKLNDARLLEIDREKKTYNALQDEYKVNLVNMTKLKEELQEQNKMAKNQQEKLVAEKTHLKESIAQAHQKVASLEELLSENLLVLNESNKKHQDNTSELEQTIASQQENISQQDEKLIFSTKQLTLLQTKKDDVSLAF
jgi:hypothetical protein